MKLLMLGGTRFVGRAVVEAAIRRGDQVSVVSRGESGEPPSDVRWVRGDRNDPAVLEQVTREEWDLVVDTWSGPAETVGASAAALAQNADWYAYVSSRSVYRWPLPAGADESAELVDTDEADPSASYAVSKLRAEQAATAHFPGRSTIARAGLILGPHEDTGRLTWWLRRTAQGGDVVAPEPPDRKWQYVDARDLAGFLLKTADDRQSGAFNVVCPTDAGATTQRMLDACLAATGGRSTLKWVPRDALRRAGIGEWDDLPGWTDPDGPGMGLHDCDVSNAIDAGLRCRPIEETVSDTWEWLSGLDPTGRPLNRADLPRRGLTAEQEQAVWWLVG